MSEPHPQPGEPVEPVRTGVPEVDAVLESIDDLDSTEVTGHTAVYESAHERLRRALDAEA